MAPASTAPSRWLRGPIWDTACLSFCWVPFYLWFVLGLRLGGEGGAVTIGGQRIEALALATMVVLGLTYVHRHYTFVLVYGDPQAFALRAREYVLLPIAALVILFSVRLWGTGVLVELGGLPVTAWHVVMLVSGSWNVWHTLQQRYGILRIYGGKAGGGLEARSAARRDRIFLWSMLPLVAVLLLSFRARSFEGHASARTALAAFEPLTSSALFLPICALVLLLVALVTTRWVREERRAVMQPSERLPRLLFLGSTLALFLVFVVHGPIVGYLTFGTAHAVEYVAFVHHFGERKFVGKPRTGNLAAQLFSRPLVAAPLLILGLGALYLGLQGYADTDTYLTYYFGSSMLHFLYDGWIWKVRTQEVAEPLGAQTPVAA